MKDCFITLVLAVGLGIGCVHFRYEIAQAWLAHETRQIRRRMSRAQRFERYLKEKLERK
ncbi:MAG: hypothetical protein ABF968_08970 [Acetobacter sp.]|uniref:hypothetical protein n=1 Tax=Acetobacter sp. TaxID=440 RepID=UPI0039E9317C